MTAAPQAPAHVAGPDRILAGMGLMVTFCIIAPLIDVASKMAVQSLPVGMVTLARYIVQGLLMWPVVLIARLPMAMSRLAFRLILLRAAVSIAATFCFIAALREMPIADALAILFVEPFVILLIGRFAMHEEVGPRRLGAAAVGFVGALLIIQPSFVAFGAVALLPLGTAVSFALYMIITRRLSREMHPVTMQLHTAIAGSVLCLPALALGSLLEAPDFGFAFAAPPAAWAWAAGVGLAATVSHMAMTYALGWAPSSTLAPLHYLEIVTATLFGYLFFGDFPGGMTWSGIGIIVASGLYVIHRERAVSKARRSQALQAAATAGRPSPL